MLDCARTLPFAEALAVTDSALRLRLVDRDKLVGAAIGICRVLGKAPASHLAGIRWRSNSAACCRQHMRGSRPT